jgi:hypothetical protein
VICVWDWGEENDSSFGITGSLVLSSFFDIYISISYLYLSKSLQISLSLSNSLSLSLFLSFSYLSITFSCYRSISSALITTIPTALAWLRLFELALFIGAPIDMYARLLVISLPAVAKFMVSILPIYLGYALFASLVFGQNDGFATLDQVRWHWVYGDVCVYICICICICVSACLRWRIHLS